MAKEFNPAEVEPRIGDVTPITMRAEYELPWDRHSNQTACGTTIQHNAGDRNWRITLEGVITLDQLSKLDQMRDQESIEILTAEWGRSTVEPDNLIVTRPRDGAVGEIRDEVGPVLEFQFQTKQEESDPVVSFVSDEAVQD